MQIIVALHYGQCFGVRDAIALTHQQAKHATPDRPLYILGQMAHNPSVRQELTAAGAREIPLNDYRHLAPGSRVMISAHGISNTIHDQLQAKHLQVIDATCPLVHRAHAALADLVRQGCQPVIIGKAGHVEVEGLRGDYPQAIVILSEEDLEKLPRLGRVGIVSQTTQPFVRVEALLDKAKRLRPRLHLEFRDTVCRPTKERQAALYHLLKQCDAILVVGGTNSNNSRQLVDTAERHGTPAYLVEHADQIQPRWFEGLATVGLTAGTSTPDRSVREVERRLRHLAASQRNHLAQGCAR